MTTFDPAIGKTTQWKKGQPSPNPGGRPKSKLLSEALRARLAEIKSDDPQSRTFAEVLAENLIALACSKERNSVAAASEIGDRVEGRPAMSLAFADVSAEVQGRSDDELRFFLTHGIWPESREMAEAESKPNGTG